MINEARLKRDRAKILWCFDIIGPDEVIPKESYEAAEKHATVLRDFMYGPSMPDSEWAPMCLPIVAMWPHSAKSHAEELAKEGLKK